MSPVNSYYERMLKKNISILFLIASVVFSGCKQNEPIGLFTEAPCPLDIPQELKESEKFSFGYMKVPEIFNEPNGRVIELAVAIFKCRSVSPTHEPLVLVGGGPGTSNLDDFVPSMAGGLGDLFLNQRDIVIVESRGLKYSRPYLGLPEIDSLQLSLLDKNLTADQTVDLYLDSLRSAYTRFTNAGVNLSAFNSLEISNEIAYVMTQLGYDKFSLFGTSYGTMVAQYLLLNHTGRLKSVVMNATIDLQNGTYDMLTNTINHFEMIFQKCESVPHLAAAYPDLKNRFLMMLKSLNENPVTLTIKYGTNDKDYKVILNGNRISAWLFGQMYGNTQLPLTLHRLIEGDFSAIEANPGLIFPLHEFSLGLSLSTFMSATPDLRAENIPIEGEYSDLVKGIGTLLFTPYFWQSAEDVWEVENKKYHGKSLVTEVPLLMLSGEMDHLCLASYAEEFADRQKNTQLYIFKGVAHSPVDQGPCAIMMLKEFFDDPSKPLNSSCVKEFKHEFDLPN
ncbi:MAG: alpha/beta hydrolase [Flavobacteriaceae bacterium]